VTEPAHPVRWWQRLYVRIYLALLASLAAYALLFLLWHNFPGSHAGPPRIAYALILLAVTVALGAFPVVRRLMARLERLQQSVDALGAGQLSARVEIEGKDEVASLAASFNRSAERIEALLRAQKTLLSNASHELRSPVTRMRMAIELMRAQPQPAPELQQELLRSMGELDQLIDEILLASRLDAAPSALSRSEWIDLTALVAEECAPFDAQFDAQAVSLHGDARLLRRLVRNLLENARRYGGGTPIQVRLATNADQAIELDVLDHGPGIAAVEREKIFLPFYRLPGASEKAGGVGLGLSLVRQIADAHGGAVQYLSPGQAGSCFRVVLPASRG
jgi:two-component system OmpR family sensor kinase